MKTPDLTEREWEILAILTAIGAAFLAKSPDEMFNGIANMRAREVRNREIADVLSKIVPIVEEIEDKRDNAIKH